MSFIYFNPNPNRKLVGDCVVRAISKITEQAWDDTYVALMLQGLAMCDMPSSNSVWGAYLTSLGFEKIMINSPCVNCYSIEDFCNDNPEGSYLLATGTHVVAVEDGNYYDTWDSGSEIPIYYFRKEL